MLYICFGMIFFGGLFFLALKFLGFEVGFIDENWGGSSDPPAQGTPPKKIEGFY